MLRQQPPPEDVTDGTLVARVRRGETAAYDELVRRYVRPAFAAAYRVLGQREDAEDLVQEAFVAALEHIDGFDTSREFRPWLLRIVVNRALNARARRTLRMTEAIPPHAASSEPGPGTGVEQSEMRMRLQAALETLPERQRTIVQLSGFEELNSSEIGELLQLPAGTVRWELHQARQALRTALAVCRESES